MHIVMRVSFRKKLRDKKYCIKTKNPKMPAIKDPGRIRNHLKPVLAGDCLYWSIISRTAAAMHRIGNNKNSLYHLFRGKNIVGMTRRINTEKNGLLSRINHFARLEL